MILTLNMLLNKLSAPKLHGEINRYTESEKNYYGLRLRKMIQCETVSEKNRFDDKEFIKLREVMKELFPLVHKKAEIKIFSDDCWVYKIPGRKQNKNIMLMSHHDVVPVKGNWKHGGFSGDFIDDCIWGRGTVDTKTPLFAEFSALEELLSEGYEPECNVYIASSHNEELGGDGIPEANRYFIENGIRFEAVLDEGGAIIDPPLSGMKCEKCAMVAVHEMGRVYLDFKAEASRQGDLTEALPATPVERMASFVNSVSKGDIFLKNVNREIRAMFKAIAPYSSFPMNFVFSNIQFFSPVLKRVMPKINSQAGALIGTTCSFNSINGSSKDKVCKARAVLKPVNGKDMERDIRSVKELSTKYGITVEKSPESEYHEPANMRRKAFKYTCKCINKVFPQYPVVPFILPAGTDARTLTDVCDCVIRFAPIRLSGQQLASVHSENENIELDAVIDCVKFYKEFLKNYR